MSLAIALPAEESRPAARSTGRIFSAWLAVRTFAWVTIACAQPNPPLDAVEWLAWGRHWQAGYHKHPPLAAWLAELASLLTPGSFAGVFLLGYLCVALALWCAWQVARDILPPRAALASVLSLDGLVHLTRDAAEFNNQVVLIGAWALAVWCCWRAVREDRWRWWVATGLALGITLWCKYTAVFLALSLGTFWLWHAPRRWPRALIVAGAAAVVFLPHLLWLIQHDFVTLRYAADRAAGEPDGHDHRLSALTFALSQTLRLLPVALPLLPLVAHPLSQFAICNRPIAPARPFLLFAVLGPVALHLLAAVALNVQLRDIWGVPLWTFLGVLLLSLSPDISDRRYHRFLALWAAVAFAMLALTAATNTAGGALRQRPMCIHYPGRQLANALTSRWRTEFSSSLPVVAGDWWLAGCVCVYSPDRPTLYASREPAGVGMSMNIRGPERYYAPEPRYSPWTSDADLQARGGVLVWDATAFGDDIPPGMKRRFPTAQARAAFKLPFAGGSDRFLRVGWAVVAP